MPRKIRERKASTLPESDTKPLIDIPEDEQWRLINETGVLHKISEQTPTSAVNSDPSPYPLVDEILDTSLFIIPFCSLLLLMEILVHNQYNRHATYGALLERMSTGGPILALFIFFIHRHKRSRRVQIFLFVLSCVVGPRLMYLIARGSWLVNMRQCPPLATIWVYTALELDLGPCVVSLGVTGAYVWWNGFQKYMFR
ncbi:hypothetical protein GYMLUDRAFT_38801 [Collybiopsis luxurians FD-317 M1]|nr:hypothetical protein GYMLUDRAFT_38801 [Collybiopsis luxurians FD-317 M1]